MSCSDTAHDKLLDVVVLPYAYCIRKLHQCILSIIRGSVNLQSLGGTRLDKVTILYQWEDNEYRLLEYSMFQCITLTGQRSVPFLEAMCDRGDQTSMPRGGPY